MMAVDSDKRVRLAAFSWLREQIHLYGDVLPRSILARGFRLDGQRVPLMGPQGIFKPRLIPSIPLSITTAPKGPYQDSFSPNGLLVYCYRGTNPQHHENAGLREALRSRTPLVYFHGIVPGRYLVVWPVFIVGDDPAGLTFTVAVDDAEFASEGLRTLSGQVIEEDVAVRRAYITRQVLQRVHQRHFRENVLRAYQEQCALCRLRHEELLDAAHIVPDSEPEGEARVSNGLALCKIHHAAYDRMFLAVRPDYTIEIRRDVLTEEDGPMLRHGLQGLHEIRIVLPRRRELRPDVALLESRYQRFLARSSECR